jgi:hypothetical protein
MAKEYAVTMQLTADEADTIAALRDGSARVVSVPARLVHPKVMCLHRGHSTGPHWFVPGDPKINPQACIVPDIVRD